ncbi:unnamed protein product [Heligmosomoides polygyrus]|uniref:NR LBD domain-containing protein n=1 Tax=Heligmosomoides polygyrus TaxID=6339 RepID=A0A183GP15_HELPZ|nr:unnamed protein product [Heligmosomoides polygyrus]
MLEWLLYPPFCVMFSKLDCKVVILQRSSPVKKRRKEVHKEKACCDVSITWDDSNDHSLKESFATDFSDIFCGEPSASTVETDTCSSDVLPTDLRLGTKLKIFARRPFPWMRDATTKFQRKNFFDRILQFNSSSVASIPPDVSPMALLESACLYWQFPSLPWLSVYPRIDALVNAATSASLIGLFPYRTECFDQLFLSWKKGDRRSFYMSCSSFTVLFTKASLDDSVGEVNHSLKLVTDVQTLYNLLQSSRVCRSIAGPHANLPPTLSASQPFLYAQMQTLRRSSQVVRKKELEYVLELDGGPIMPHAIPLVSLRNIFPSADFLVFLGMCRWTNMFQCLHRIVIYMGYHGRSLLSMLDSLSNRRYGRNRLNNTPVLGRLFQPVFNALFINGIESALDSPLTWTIRIQTE